MSEEKPDLLEFHPPGSNGHQAPALANGVSPSRNLETSGTPSAPPPEPFPVQKTGALEAGGDWEAAQMPEAAWEAIASRLRSRGWSLNWFAFDDRDGQSRWRVSTNTLGWPSFMIQAEDLHGAFSALETLCRKAELDRAEPTATGS